MKKAMKLAVVGVDTAIGEALIKQLESDSYQLEHFLPLALDLEQFDLKQEATASEEDSEEDIDSQAPTSIRLKGESYPVEAISDCQWHEVDIAIFCLDAADLGDWAHIVSEYGVTVIDTSDALLHNSEVRLQQAHIKLDDYIEAGTIIRTADPLSVILAQALAPIENELGIEQINVTAMLSASHMGKTGVNELAGETARLLNGLPAEPKSFPMQSAFNVIPYVGDINPNGHSKLEEKVAGELTQLIAHDLTCNITAVQVPLFYGYNLVVDIQTRIPVELEEAQTLFNNSEHLQFYSDTYPTAVNEMLKSDEIMVARLRQNPQQSSHLSMWVLADNIKVASAINALKIACSI